MHQDRRKSVSPDHPHATSRQHKPSAHKRITRKQQLHLARRFAVLAVAVAYVYVSINASIASLRVLRGAITPLEIYEVNEAKLISHYVGAATIRESKLLREVLGDVTMPRNETLYLDSPTATSLTNCSTPKFNPDLYSNEFIRNGYAILVGRGLYSLKFLSDYELILPVVDCTFTGVERGDNTFSRIFYLTRRKDNPEDVYVVTSSLSIQSYIVVGEYQKGAAAVVSFSFINDMRATEVTHYFVVAMGYPYTSTPSFDVVEYSGKTLDGKLHFRSVPRDPATEAVKVIHSAKRKGFFIKEENSQANVKNMHYEFEDDPLAVMSVWDWRGNTLVQDSWAWVHCIHAIFALTTLFNHCVLFLIMYRNVQKGKIWVGDAFASISNTLLLRGALVLVSWHVNEYWTIAEMCLAAGYDVAGIQRVVFFPEIGHADFLTLFLGAADILGSVTKERIDPAFSIVVFELGFLLRVELIRSLPAFLKGYIVDYSTANFENELVKVSKLLEAMAPLRLWDIYALKDSSLLFRFVSSLSSMALTMGSVACYVIARKLYRKYSPRHAKHVHYAPNGDQQQTQPKTTMTFFEIATGAERQNKFGVIVDYDNFVYFKGLKFASADGIYCNGFVIANGKFLLATEDIFVIILMKILRVRFRNMYIYDVDGSKIKQTARIVYPDTISWNDLWHPNVDVLS